jgi:ribose 5-phosphate isomerase B
MDSARLQAIVKRVTQRVLNQGRSAAFGERVSGVHVDLGVPGGTAPGAGQASLSSGNTGSEAPSRLITSEDLAQAKNGEPYFLPAGARPTALAEEEAWRRGIDLRSGSGQGGSRLRVAVGADHGGFPVKELVKQWLAELGHQVLDLGTHSTEAVDYPDFARAVAEAVVNGRADFGVCVDGAGIGSCMAANKVPGARAAMCYDEKTASNAREHNFANVLSLGGPMLGDDACRRILVRFLETPEGASRHARRVDKIRAIETRYSHQDQPLRRVLPESGGT